MVWLTFFCHNADMSVVGKISQRTLFLGVAITLLTSSVSAIAPQKASAAGVCNPVLQTSSNDYTVKEYIFSSVGSCTWTVPLGLGTLKAIDMTGGGGGGGAGSFAGVGNIGGGGGGGSMGGANRFLSTGWTLTPGTSVTVNIGAGGTGGSATSLGAAGNDGGDGGATSWTPVSGTTVTAAGGKGGKGGSFNSGPVGGAGGDFPGMRLANGAAAGLAKGGTGYNGNGGGGAGPYTNGGSGTTTSSGSGSSGQIGYLPVGVAGTGGTSGVSSNTAPNTYGGSASNAARSYGNVGNGGGGGAGCNSATPCANISGASGVGGYIILRFSFSIASSLSSDSYATGQSVNKLIATASPLPDSATWFWSGGTLPNGLKLATVVSSNGVHLYLQGVPTKIQSSTQATFSLIEPISRWEKMFYINLTITKGGQSSFALSNSTLFNGQQITLAATGALSSASTTYSSNSSSCVLSGANNSILTASSGSGTCLITATNAGDTNFDSATATATMSLTTTVPSVKLTTARLSALVGSVETLTATLTNGATGSVTFRQGGVAISNCGSNGVVAVSASRAICLWTPASSSASPTTLSISYSGDGTYSAGSDSITGYEIFDPLFLTYSDTSTIYGVQTNIVPATISGAGSPSSWEWSIVKTSDSSIISGISISGGTISVSGNLAAIAYPMTVSATDDLGRVVNATITITVNKVTPTLSLIQQTVAGVPVYGITVGRQIQLVANLSVSSGGTATIYANGTAVCSNLFVFSGSANCFWGPSDTSTASFTFYATTSGDSNTNPATSATSAAFPVNGALSFTYPAISIATGDYGSSTPVITGGTGPLSAWTWSIWQFFTGNAITGITIDSTGNVYADESLASGTYQMVVIGTDPTGANNSYTMTITASSSATPQFSITPSSQTGSTGSAITGNTVSNSGPVITSFGISPAVPSGLSFNPSTGVLSGTPVNAQGATTYTITGYNSAGSLSRTFSLTVNAGAPTVATISISLPGGAKTATYRTAITITANVSQNGKVTFFSGTKRIPGGISKASASGTVACSWKPTTRGGYSLKAYLRPTDSTYAAVTSSDYQVGVTSRTTRR